MGIIFSTIAVVISTGLWVTIEDSGPPRHVSLAFALATVAVLMIVARLKHLSTFARWWQLIGGGFACVLGISRAFAPGFALWQVFGLLVAFAGLALVRLAFTKDGQP